MNKVLLTGKIRKIYKPAHNVIFVTVHCKDSRNSEFLDVTVFQTKFFERYFCEGMWISITGRMHKNAKNGYKQEIIAETIDFAGDAKEEPTTEPTITDIPPEWMNNGEADTPQPNYPQIAGASHTS